MAHRLTAATLLLAALLSLSSCSTATRAQPSASPSSTSGIDGIAVTGPVGPGPFQKSPLPGGFGMSTNIPARHTPLVVRDAGGAVVARLKSDERGLFRISLPPGTYAVRGTGFSKVKTKVVVKTGSYTRAVCYAYYHF
jgi:hypothetical protein